MRCNCRAHNGRSNGNLRGNSIAGSRRSSQLVCRWLHLSNFSNRREVFVLSSLASLGSFSCQLRAPFAGFRVIFQVEAVESDENLQVRPRVRCRDKFNFSLCSSRPSGCRSKRFGANSSGDSEGFANNSTSELLRPAPTRQKDSSIPHGASPRQRSSGFTVACCAIESSDGSQVAAASREIALRLASVLTCELGNSSRRSPK